ncbi:MAG: hypothetical protein V4574_20130 [Pseudomonadota bacterium]
MDQQAEKIATVGQIDPHDLEMVAMLSTEGSRAIEAVFAIDDMMRANYDALRARVAEQLSPVIIVRPDLSGGAYTLVHDGTQTTVHPTSPQFQLAKSVCHTPLGLFSILAPYLDGPASGDWEAPLSAFRAVLAKALPALEECGLPDDAVAASQTILDGAIAFADTALSQGSFSIEDFQTYTRAVAGAIEQNMMLAAQTLVQGVQAQLSAWRDALGPAWKDLYVVILAIWTTERRNQHWVILNDMMDPETVGDHLITVSVGEQDEVTVPVALDNLARIVQDKVAAVMVFSALPEEQRLQVALADPTDLLADDVALAIKSCPRSTVHRVAVKAPG